MIMIIKMISILIQLLATQDRYYKSHMLGCRKMRRSCIEEVLCQQIAKLQVHRKNSRSQNQNKICGSLSLGTTFLLESEMISILRVPGICQTFGYTIIPYPLSLSYIFLKKNYFSANECRINVPLLFPSIPKNFFFNLKSAFVFFT